MTIRELEDDLNNDPRSHVGHMDLSPWTSEEIQDYKEWLEDEYKELHKYDNISEAEAWDLA